MQLFCSALGPPTSSPPRALTKPWINCHEWAFLLLLSSSGALLSDSCLTHIHNTSTDSVTIYRYAKHLPGEHSTERMKARQKRIVESSLIFHESLLEEALTAEQLHSSTAPLKSSSGRTLLALQPPRVAVNMRNERQRDAFLITEWHYKLTVDRKGSAALRDLIKFSRPQGCRVPQCDQKKIHESARKNSERTATTNLNTINFNDEESEASRCVTFRPALMNAEKLSGLGSRLNRSGTSWFQHLCKYAASNWKFCCEKPSPAPSPPPHRALSVRQVGNYRRCWRLWVRPKRSFAYF